MPVAGFVSGPSRQQAPTSSLYYFLHAIGDPHCCLVQKMNRLDIKGEKTGMVRNLKTTRHTLASHSVLSYVHGFLHITLLNLGHLFGAQARLRVRALDTYRRRRPNLRWHQRRLHCCLEASPPQASSSALHLAQVLRYSSRAHPAAPFFVCTHDVRSLRVSALAGGGDLHTFILSDFSGPSTIDHHPIWPSLPSSSFIHALGL